jgi:hypothetical protein
MLPGNDEHSGAFFAGNRPSPPISRHYDQRKSYTPDALKEDLAKRSAHQDRTHQHAFQDGARIEGSEEESRAFGHKQARSVPLERIAKA